MKLSKFLSFSVLPALVATSVAAGDFAFVTNQNSSDLSVLDLDTRTEVTRIAVPGKPAGVAAVGRVFYTVSPDSKMVRKFDATSRKILAELQLDGGPIGIAHDSAGNRVFVSDWYNARIWVIDAETLQVAGTLETGAAPAGVAVSPDGKWLASADRDADQVSIFDLATLEVQQRVTVGTRPFGLSFAPDGRLFVANVGTNDVTVLAADSFAPVGTVTVGERPYGIAFAQGRGFVTNQYADTVSVFDLSDLAPLAVIDVGEYPEGIDTTGDDSTIVVANWFSNTVSLIDAQTLQVVGEIETGDGPRAFGKFIAQGNPQ